MKKLRRIMYLVLAIIICIMGVTPVNAIEKTPFTGINGQVDTISVSENTPYLNNAISVSENTIEDNGLEDYLKSQGIVNGYKPSDNYYEFPDRQTSDIQLFNATSELGIDATTSSYDPRENGKISAVRDQVSGTCWVYAALATCESNPDT